MISLINKKFKIDSLELLSKIENKTISCSFLDFQYRSVLDKMQYGNEGVKQKGRYWTPSMSDEYIQRAFNLVADKTKESAYIFLWSDMFNLVQGYHNNLVNNYNLDKNKKEKLVIVDLIVWDKKTFGMGHRSRRTCEYLVVIQKSPILAKKTWSNHSIRDVWSEKIPKKIHTHAKPYGLIKTLIECVTIEDDTVLDPCAGSFVVLDVCEQSNRKFIGTDIVYGDYID